MTDLDIKPQLHSMLQQAVLDYLNKTDLDSLIGEILVREIDQSVANLAKNAVTNLLRDRDLQTEIETWVKNDVADKLVNSAKSAISTQATRLDLTEVARKVLYDQIHNHSLDLKFPAASIDPMSINWHKAKIDAGVIDSGVYKNFRSVGINDYSTQLQLRITDDGVVVEHNIVTKNMLVEDRAFVADMTVERDLELQGNLLLSSNAVSTISQIAEAAIKHQNSLNLDVDLTGKSIMSEGSLVLDADQLGPSVLTSNLRKLGNLVDLNVLGDVNMAEVLNVSTTGKVGINTYEPMGALTIWDQDAEFSFSKIKRGEMFAGSSRNTTVTLGSNNQNQIRLTDNTVEINQRMRFMGRLFSIVDKIPEHLGEPGEFALHANNIYVCQSGSSWQKIC